jgi:hypothetical protein
LTCGCFWLKARAGILYEKLRLIVPVATRLPSTASFEGQSTFHQDGTYLRSWLDGCSSFPRGTVPSCKNVVCARKVGLLGIKCPTPPTTCQQHYRAESGRLQPAQRLSIVLTTSYKLPLRRLLLISSSSDIDIAQTKLL